ncbi:hypothetical protein GF351_02760 [Candidatus Woesearchaeota archaeon]|nr:hypothetical protein [Candidatus Woesearchaeota archaeon]
MAQMHLLVGVMEPEKEISPSDRKVSVKMMEERDELMKNLDKEGIPYTRVWSKWPQDDFVSHKGEVFLRKDYGFYADGGYVFALDSMIIVGEHASRRQKGYNHTPEQRGRILKMIFGETDYVVLPSPDCRWHPDMVPHIDLVSLPVPQKAKMYVDKRYLDMTKNSCKDDAQRILGRRGNVLEEITERLGMELKAVRHDYSRPSYPCNTQVVEHEGDLYAITNSDSKEFVHMLRKDGFRVIAVPFSANCSRGGSVHCATNLCPADKVEEIAGFLPARQKDIYDR